MRVTFIFSVLIFLFNASLLSSEPEVTDKAGVRFLFSDKEFDVFQKNIRIIQNVFFDVVSEKAKGNTGSYIIKNPEEYETSRRICFEFIQRVGGPIVIPDPRLIPFQDHLSNGKSGRAEIPQENKESGIPRLKEKQHVQIQAFFWSDMNVMHSQRDYVRFVENIESHIGLAQKIQLCNIESCISQYRNMFDISKFLFTIYDECPREIQIKFDAILHSILELLESEGKEFIKAAYKLTSYSITNIDDPSIKGEIEALLHFYEGIMETESMTFDRKKIVEAGPIVLLEEDTKGRSLESDLRFTKKLVLGYRHAIAVLMDKIENRVAQKSVLEHPVLPCQKRKSNGSSRTRDTTTIHCVGGYGIGGSN